MKVGISFERKKGKMRQKKRIISKEYNCVRQNPRKSKIREMWQIFKNIHDDLCHYAYIKLLAHKAYPTMETCCDLLEVSEPNNGH